MEMVSKQTMGKYTSIITKATGLLQPHGIALIPAQLQVDQLVPDGSTRIFLRLKQKDQQVVCVLPPEGDRNGTAESRSFFAIGRHLQGQGVPVPFVYGFAESCSMVVCEDLGNSRLHDLLAKEQGMTPRLLQLYEQAVRTLAHMQVKGARSFDPTWCWDTPVYDMQVMLEKESGYFLQAFCRDYLELTFDSEAVREDCVRLAQAAAKAPAEFFLHRDFQSRNIMVAAGDVRIIDYQGGRLGPLAYDLASLLLDPYARLAKEIRDHLTCTYLKELDTLCKYDHRQFFHELLLLSLQRNLQILGAFAFLTRVRQKPFFQQFLAPALTSLIALLEKPAAAEYAALYTLTRQCRTQLDKKI